MEETEQEEMTEASGMPAKRGIGFWYGGQRPPSEGLIARLEDEEDRVSEIYALQSGRQRGNWVAVMDTLRERLASVPRRSEQNERRSVESALRRALGQFPRDAEASLDILLELGDSLGTDDDLVDWLHAPTGEGKPLDALWRPADGSLLAHLADGPPAAAAWILDWLCTERGGPVRILDHSLHGVTPSSRRLLADSAIAAFHLGADVHLFSHVNHHLAVWEQARIVDVEGSPLSLRDTLLLHELTEVAVEAREGMGPEAAHVVAVVMERLCGRAVELAEAAKVLFEDQRAEADLEPLQVPRRRAADEDHRRPVLVADDSSIGRHMITMLLRRLGHPVLEATGGAEAVSHASDQNPQLIILDIGMPDVDGLSALARIRDLPDHGTTPTIIVSAMRDAETILGARKLGVVDYLTKPVDTKDLAARIDRHLKAEASRSTSG
jgi:CheY-like chemotaxis protein